MDCMLPCTGVIGVTMGYCEKVARQIKSPQTKKDEKIEEENKKKKGADTRRVQCEECHEWFENEEKMTWHSLNWLSSNNH